MYVPSTSFPSPIPTPHAASNNHAHKRNCHSYFVQQTLNNKQSQAVKANGQIFLSGQIPADKNGNLVEGDIRTKTQACCDNIKAILDAAGSSVDKIIRVNVSRVV